MTDLRYPIGEFQMKAGVSESDRALWIDEVAVAPAELRKAILGLDQAQLDTPYRPDGWTVRQVVHHVPESHLNCYTRYKLALTENQPVIKPYMEERWAETAEVRITPVEVSLTLLEALHQRWVLLLRSLRGEDFNRTFVHPEIGVQTLERTLALYAWHGRHHVAHITSLRGRMGW